MPKLLKLSMEQLMTRASAESRKLWSRGRSLFTSSHRSRTMQQYERCGVYGFARADAADARSIKRGNELPIVRSTQKTSTLRCYSILPEAEKAEAR